MAVLLEQNFMKNIKHVIGVDYPFFGKMLYLWMSGGYNKAKITMYQFIENMMVFVKDDKNAHIRTCFKILDIDGDGLINILNLLHLYRHMSIRTLLGREVMLMIDEYLSKNVFTSPLVIKKTEINFELFFKIVGGKCCIKDEIRRKFWGFTDPEPGPYEPNSICEEFTDKQNNYYNSGKKLEPRESLFENMDYYEDTCYGQRGFGRNVDRLCNSLINGYHTQWKV